MSKSMEIVFPEREELLQLAEDMFTSSVNLTQAAVVKPSGMILSVGSGPVQYMTGTGGVLEAKVGPAWMVRQALYQDEITRNALAFISGAVYGYYKDADMVYTMWLQEFSVEAFYGLDIEVINAAAERIMSVTEGRVQDDDDSESMACWLTGCMVGDYTLTTGKMMEEMQ